MAGERVRSRGVVARTAVYCWRTYERIGGPVGGHLAEVIASFLPPLKFRIEPKSGDVWRISL
jgi:hypothetical protein